MSLKISKKAFLAANSAIIISGSAKSGTTIVGKIIHSFKNVEYEYEPPFLFTLISTIHNFSKDDWKLLYETYLYEDFFLNSICGRRINCNKIDESSIYRTKSLLEIKSKLSSSIPKNKLEYIASQYSLAYKIPDVTNFLKKLTEYYSGSRVVIVNRDAIGTINSLLQGRWFHDENIKSNVIWPFRICKNLHVPCWVKKNDDEKWLKMSEIDRCAYYYIMVNEGAEGIQSKIDISYNELLKCPAHVVKKLSERLALSYGEKTEEIITQVKRSKAVKDYNILDKISPELAELVKFYSNKYAN